MKLTGYLCVFLGAGYATSTAIPKIPGDIQELCKAACKTQHQALVAICNTLPTIWHKACNLYAQFIGSDAGQKICINTCTLFGLPGVPGIPGLPGIPGIPTIPGVPTIPTTPSIPGTPTIPSVPTIPATPTIPGIPTIPSIPSIPGIPTIPGVPTGVPGLPV